MDTLLKHVQGCSDCPHPYRFGSTFIPVGNLCRKAQSLFWAHWDKVYGYSTTETVQ